MKSFLFLAGFLLNSTICPAQPAAESREALEERVIRLASLAPGDLRPNYKVVEDATDFISPFTQGRANKAQFFALKGLDLDDTLAVIRGEGVPVIFINSSNPVDDSELVRKNVGVDERTRSLLESDFRHQKDGSQETLGETEGVYLHPHTVLTDEQGNKVPNPFKTPAIVLDLGAINDPDQVIYRIQHEYLHHLFEPQRAQNDRLKHQLLDAHPALADRTAKLFAQLEKDPKNSKLETAFCDAAIDSVLSKQKLVLLGFAPEWDALWVQLETRKQMGLSAKASNSILGFLVKTFISLTDQALTAEFNPIFEMAVRSRKQLSDATLNKLAQTLTMRAHLAQAAENLRYYISMPQHRDIIDALKSKPEAKN